TNGKSHAAGGGGRSRSCRRSARSLFGVPGITRHAAKPFVALRQRAQSEFGDKDRAGSVEPFDHGGVFINLLVFKSSCAPRGAISLNRQQVLCSPRQSMQRAAVLACRNFTVGLFGLRQRALFR